MLFRGRDKAAIAGRDFLPVSILCSIFSAFIVLSFREYFFFIPNFSRPYPVIALVQGLTAIGWISLITLPPLALLNWSRLDRFGSAMLLIGALVWPFSTLLIKVLNLIFYGNPFIGYLGDHPLFLLMEYAIPGLYLYIWLVKRSQI